MGCLYHHVPPLQGLCIYRRDWLSCKIQRWKTVSKHNRVDAHEFTETMVTTKCSNQAISKGRGSGHVQTWHNSKLLRGKFCFLFWFCFVLFLFSALGYINYIPENEQKLRSYFPSQTGLNNWLGFLDRGEFIIVKSEKEMKFEGLETWRTWEGLGKEKEYEQNVLHHILKS